MARLNVNPNRMELTALREKLAVAKRGHKLLKDKQDALMQSFVALADRAKLLRKEVEAELTKINSSFVLAAAMTDQERMLQSLSYQPADLRLHVKSRRLLNLHVPAFTIQTPAQEPPAKERLYPYSFESTSGDMDMATIKLGQVLPNVIALAEQESACFMLAEEIRRTRRRVNALEFRIIVDLEETIAYVLMQINENERNNIARLMSMTDEQ